MEEQVSRLNSTLVVFRGTFEKLEASLAEQNNTIRKLVKERNESSNEKAKPKISTHLANGVAVDPQRDRSLVSVYTRVVFLKVGEIDTVNEVFEASIFLECRWHEPLLEDLDKEDLIDVDATKYWNPKLTVDNMQGVPSKHKVWHEVTKIPQGRVFITEKTIIAGKFTENMELQCFPLDTQQLTAHITSERFGDEVRLVPDPAEKSAVNVQAFTDQQEWKLHDFVEVEVCHKGPTVDSNDARPPHPRMQMFCHASRRPGYFLFNIVLVMIFICSLAFSTFAIDIALPQNRLQLSFTLVLTMITFKLTASSSIPKVSYLTYLDHYVFTSMSLLSFVCIWHAVVHVIERHHSFDNAVLADKIVMAVMMAAYLIVQLVFAIRLYKQLQRRSGRLPQPKQDDGLMNDVDAFFDPVADSLADNNPHANYPI